MNFFPRIKSYMFLILLAGYSQMTMADPTEQPLSPAQEELVARVEARSQELGNVVYELNGGTVRSQQNLIVQSTEIMSDANKSQWVVTASDNQQTISLDFSRNPRGTQFNGMTDNSGFVPVPADFSGVLMSTVGAAPTFNNPEKARAVSMVGVLKELTNEDAGESTGTELRPQIDVFAPGNIPVKADGANVFLLPDNQVMAIFYNSGEVLTILISIPVADEVIDHLDANSNNNSVAMIMLPPRQQAIAAVCARLLDICLHSHDDGAAATACGAWLENHCVNTL